MSAVDDPLNPGRHLLGPHVVGKRVVIRHLLPDGRATDVLGVCTSWSDGVCEVDPSAGSGGTGDRGPVSIRIDRIVSGKPVPPRPSVRSRISARDAELHTAALWPRVTTTPLGDWVLRHDPAPVGRLRRRASSCLAMGDPGMPTAEALAQVERFYADAGRPAYVQVEAGDGLEATLREEGWQHDPTGDASFLMASVARVRRGLREVPPAAVELSVSGDHAHAGIGTGCDPLGEAEAALSGDWLGIHGVAVDPGHRRRGFATALVAELLEWGAERGATTAWLHVETTNGAALALYDGLGFAVHHTCRYYRAGSGT